jgi:hypothetical protein
MDRGGRSPGHRYCRWQANAHSAPFPQTGGEIVRQGRGRQPRAPPRTAPRLRADSARVRRGPRRGAGRAWVRLTRCSPQRTRVDPVRTCVSLDDPAGQDPGTAASGAGGAGGCSRTVHALRVARVPWEDTTSCRCARREARRLSVLVSSCEHAFVTSDGHAHARFRRALLTKNVILVDAAARELHHGGLDDALRVLVVFAERCDALRARGGAVRRARGDGAPTELGGGPLRAGAGRGAAAVTRCLRAVVALLLPLIQRRAQRAGGDAGAGPWPEPQAAAASGVPVSKVEGRVARPGLMLMRPGPRKVSQRARRARRVKGPGFASGPQGGPALTGCP